MELRPVDSQIKSGFGGPQGIAEEIPSGHTRELRSDPWAGPWGNFLSGIVRRIIKQRRKWTRIGDNVRWDNRKGFKDNWERKGLGESREIEDEEWEFQREKTSVHTVMAICSCQRESLCDSGESEVKFVWMTSDYCCFRICGFGELVLQVVLRQELRWLPTIAACVNLFSTAFVLLRAAQEIGAS